MVRVLRLFVLVNFWVRAAKLRIDFIRQFQENGKMLLGHFLNIISMLRYDLDLH